MNDASPACFAFNFYTSALQADQLLTKVQAQPCSRLGMAAGDLVITGK